jgi:ribosomal protein L18E
MKDFDDTKQLQQENKRLREYINQLRESQEKTVEVAERNCAELMKENKQLRGAVDFLRLCAEKQKEGQEVPPLKMIADIIEKGYHVLFLDRHGDDD